MYIDYIINLNNRLPHDYFVVASPRPPPLPLFFHVIYTILTRENAVNYDRARTNHRRRQWSRGILNDTCDVNRTWLFFDYNTCILWRENNARKVRSHKIWCSFLSLFSLKKNLVIIFPALRIYNSDIANPRLIYVNSWRFHINTMRNN